MKEFPYLCKPITINTVEIKNRMFMAPMDTGFGNTSWGEFTPAGIEYFVRRAQGGFGLLFSGGVSVNAELDGTDTILNHKDEFKAQGEELNSRIAEYGAKMFMQLSFNVGRNGGLKTPSPLPVLNDPKVKTQALTKDEIKRKVDSMGEAAALCKEAGFAGIDNHAMHWGHLLDSFAMSFMNRREDEYGGSLENRLRAAKEIVEVIKSRCGGDYPVTMRMALKSYMKDFNKASFDGSGEVGRTPEEAIETGKLLEQYGYDGLSVDAGTLDSFYYAMPPSYVPKGYVLDMAAELKSAVSIPVFCGARMADPEIDETAIAQRKIDAVVIGRQAIADPDFAKKITKAKPKEVRTCIGCNQGCIWGYFLNGNVGCAVNPEVGYELDMNITKTTKNKKAVIVGGGVAGMEAARVAKLRGFDVILYEKTDKLGGNLIPAGAEEFKSEVAELNEYYKNQMKLLGVDVKLETEATPDLLKESDADAIILAVGSLPVIPKIDGIDNPKTISGADALLGKKPIGKNVVIIGGGLVGCETAFGYASRGKNVTIVESLDEIMKNGSVPGMNKQMLLDAFDYYNVKVITDTRVKAINDEGAVVITADGSEKTIPADNVIISIGYKSLHSMKEKLADLNIPVYEAGDGAMVGNVMTSIKAAHKAAAEL